MKWSGGAIKPPCLPAQPQRDFIVGQRNPGIVHALFRELASNLDGVVPIRGAGRQSPISTKAVDFQTVRKQDRVLEKRALNLEVRVPHNSINVTRSMATFGFFSTQMTGRKRDPR
jgi:predicted amino acid-binding ACT domain protein